MESWVFVESSKWAYYLNAAQNSVHNTKEY